MTDFMIARIRLAHCKRGPEICDLCRAYAEGRYCLLDINPDDRGLMQRRTIEVKRESPSEWREFDVVTIFENEDEAKHHAETEGIFINPL